jgi:hypothetical protein
MQYAMNNRPLAKLTASGFACGFFVRQGKFSQQGFVPLQENLTQYSEKSVRKSAAR